MLDSILKLVITGGMPPKQGDTAALYAYLWWLWVKFWVIFIIIVWMLGIFPGTGFVKAGDFQVLERNIIDGRVDTLSSDIFKLRVQQCNAPSGSTLKTAYGESLSKLLEKYQKLTGHNYQLQACRDLSGD